MFYFLRGMSELFFKKESYAIIGICMEVHRVLGMGFKEIVYKDALIVEFTNKKIPFTKEQLFSIEYKGIILPHKFCADFVLFDSIILEVKSAPIMLDKFFSQTLNYIKAAKLKLGIIANFGEQSFNYKRVVY